MALSAGTRLGPYEILEPLGAGGMGEVYRARDPRLKREVALKVLPPELASKPERLARFEREAQTLAALNHPHIVTIHSVEEADDLHFLTMELVEGKALAQVIPRTGLSLSRFFRIAIPRDGENCYQLTFGDYAGAPKWSPSGRSITFHLERPVNAGKTTFDIFVMDAKGGVSRAVMQDEFVNAAPRWSADERWIYFWSDRAGERQIFKISTVDQQIVQVTRKGGWSAFEDDDGRFVYYAKEDPREGLWRVPVDGGEETPVLGKPVHSLGWCLWRQNIVYINQEGKKAPAIELFDLTTSETKEWTSLGPDAEPRGLAVSPDGRWILYAEADVKSDIMLVESFR